MRTKLIELYLIDYGITVYAAANPNDPKIIQTGEAFDADFPPLRKDLKATKVALQAMRQAKFAARQAEMASLDAQIAAVQAELDAPPVVP
jgi:hypothetical protein